MACRSRRASSLTSRFEGPASPLVACAAQVVGLLLPTGAAALSGLMWQASYLCSTWPDRQRAAELVTRGIEYVCPAGLTPRLCTHLLLSYNGLGRTYPETGYASSSRQRVRLRLRADGQPVEENDMWGVVLLNGTASNGNWRPCTGRPMWPKSRGWVPLMEETQCRGRVDSCSCSRRSTATWMASWLAVPLPRCRDYTRARTRTPR